MQPIIAPQTTILSVLNGLQSESTLLAGLRDRDGAPITQEQVPLCIALAMAAEREGRHARFTQAGRLLFGPAEGGGEPTARMEALAAAFEKAGLDYGMPDDMRHQMWWKFMVNVSVNQPSAVLRAPYGVFTAPGPARDLMDALIAEVRDVAAAEGVALDQGDVDRWYAVLDAQPADGFTSTHQDVLAGRPTEVDLFAGHVVELGRRHGIAVPVNQTMLWLLRAETAMARADVAGS